MEVYYLDERSISVITTPYVSGILHQCFESYYIGSLKAIDCIVLSALILYSVRRSIYSCKGIQ